MQKNFFFFGLVSFIALFCICLSAPSFAAMKNIDEGELARTNASVTGSPAQDPIPYTNNDNTSQEIIRDGLSTMNKGNNAFPPPVSGTDPIMLNLNVGGQTTFNFYFGGGSSTTTGGITGVKTY